MGGSSKSSSSTSNINTNIDSRLATAENSQMTATQVYGDGNTVLDGGAIQGAFDTVRETTAGMMNIFASAINSSNQNTQNAFDFANNMKATENERVITKMMPYLVIGVGILALAYIMTNSKGKRKRK